MERITISGIGWYIARHCMGDSGLLDFFGPTDLDRGLEIQQVEPDADFLERFNRGPQSTALEIEGFIRIGLNVYETMFFPDLVAGKKVCLLDLNLDDKTVLSYVIWCCTDRFTWDGLLNALSNS